MEPFVKLTGIVAPLDAMNADTDQIIPKQFLKRVGRTGYEDALFYDWRFLEDGKTLNPEFELNAPRYHGASILLARDNFGCGSSREHAPWALTDYGFRAVISTRVADIFKNNALKNGLLPIVVEPAAHAQLVAAPGFQVRIDLESQTVTLPAGGTAKFPIERFSRYCLMNGVDELGFLLTQSDAIAAFESKV